MNKKITKIIVKNAGIEVPIDWVLARDGSWVESLDEVVEEMILSMGLPVFVKDLRSGSSIGVCRCDEKGSLKDAIQRLGTKADEIMVEKAVAGREVTCGVIGSPRTGYEALPPVEIVAKGDFFDFKCKYDPTQAQEICPAPIGESGRHAVAQAAVKAAGCLCTRGIVRADFILTNDRLWFLEMNTIPGLTPESIVLKEAKVLGIGLDRLMDRLIRSTLDECRLQNRPLPILRQKEEG